MICSRLRWPLYVRRSTSAHLNLIELKDRRPFAALELILGSHVIAMLDVALVTERPSTTTSGLRAWLRPRSTASNSFLTVSASVPPLFSAFLLRLCWGSAH